MFFGTSGDLAWLSLGGISPLDKLAAFSAFFRQISELNSRHVAAQRANQLERARNAGIQTGANPSTWRCVGQSSGSGL